MQSHEPIVAAFGLTECEVRNTDVPARAFENMSGGADLADVADAVAMLRTFAERDDWNNPPYRIVWVSRIERAVLTYCEGDLSLVVTDDDRGFDRYLATIDRFYREHV